ncbi:ABC transporter substrate-binding protein [Leptospira langatensis]|uniref:ABC transporter substrate-binding protein n=1 Tax=Leptospira langatensis TaxID=2484983 RepID=A0A5F1ZXT1_9LEPT|nr:extracellular solute-binding protein [Leptospira langatensis]TGK00326.1 ABC transporter substrate-binding protein [Leptospira langatensis]TGL42813.1 ABC transporter substrate-binding protein [Leptospira langatensis]
MYRPFYFIFLLFVTLFFSFVSCGDKEEADNSPAVTDLPWTGDPNSIPEAMRKLNPAASIHAKKGGTFRIYSSQYPKSLNGYLENFTTVSEIFQLMFEPLMRRNPITLDPLPRLASSWKISPDKKRFTFTLDRNAKWSDGKPVTAQDVLFTYQTLMDPKNNTAIHRISLSRFEVPKIINEFEIEFTQKSIHWSNFEDIAYGLLILPEHHFKNKEFNKENFEFPVTSGPYELQSAKKGRYIKMKRRADYWMRAYPFYKGSDNFDTLLFKVFSDESLAFQAFKKGDIDLFPVYKAYTWIKEALGEPFDKNYIIKQKIYNEKPIGFQGWAFNMRRKPFDDVRVRKAIAHLVDRKLMVEKLAFNEYELTDSYFSSVWEGSALPNPPIDYDPAAARKLLSEAGWKPNAKGFLEKEGKPFVIHILDRDKSSEKYFTVFIERAKEVGIQVQLESTDLANWSERIDKYDFDLTWAAWGGGLFPDPEEQWFSKYADENGQNNITGFKNAEVDKLVEQQRTEFDEKKRAEIARKIDKILTREVPYVLLWNLKSTRLLYWNRFGFPENPLAKYWGEQAAKNLWWVDEEKAKSLETNRKAKTALSTYPKDVHYK